MPLPKKKNLITIYAGLLTAVLIYIFALYSVPLQSRSFYFDDNSSIVENQAIKSLDIHRIFDAFNTRFLVGLSFALNYQFSALNPGGYRFINLMIHCFNAFLVYLLIRQTLYLYSSRKRIFSIPLEWPALFGAMLFLCHPIQTEPVNFITQRFVLMGSFFYLLSLYLYILYRCRSKKIFLIAGLVSAAAAMLCKEFTATLPVMLVVYEFYFLDSRDETWHKRCGRIVPFLIIALIVPLLLLRTTPQMLGVAKIADSDSFSHMDITRALGSVSRHEYFLTELNVMRTYVRLLFLPVNQDLDYDYPLSTGDANTLLSGLFLILLLAIAVFSYQKFRIISFGILWFFIALSVESSIIPIGHVIAEYRVYLASAGFAFIIMNLIYMLPASPRRLNLIAAGIIIGFSIVTFQRNRVWRDEIALWGDTAQKSPHKARAQYCLGYAYFNKGDFNKALTHFDQAVQIKPNYIEALVNRGIIYFEEGRMPQALADYDKVIKLDDNVAEAFYNRGNVFLKQNNLSRAILDYDLAIKLNPRYAEAYTNLGSICVRQGDWVRALFYYNKAIDIYPRVMFPSDFHVWLEGIKNSSVGFLTKSHFDSYADAYYNRGCVYDRLGNLTQALSDYNMAVEINPGHADAYNNRGYIYSRQGYFDQAISDFNKAIEINPNIAGYYYNRGVPDSKLGNIAQAIADFSRAIALNPEYADAYYNRAIFYYELKEYTLSLADVKRAQTLGSAVNPEFFGALYKSLK